MSFVPLRVQSHGSLLWGTASPEALIERALELGYAALALTDRDNLYLAIRFYQQARAEGLRPLLGATVTAGAHEALLLPVDRRGYSHLCRILTHRHLDSGFDLVQLMSESDPEPLWTGLHVVVESPGWAAALKAAGVPAARGVDPATGRDGAARGPLGGLWLGIRGLPAERARLGERVAMARRLGVPLVATGDAVLLAPADHDAHRAAVTAAAGELLERMPDSAFAARDATLVAPAERERRVRAVCAGGGVPVAAREALANNRALAERCRLEIDLGQPIFPRAPLPAGASAPEHLAGLCEAGLGRRYPRDRDAARARLRDELAMIERMGFVDYFLLVAEIVEFARARGIPTVGRGSGASSIVAYVLGITNVDPLRHGLTFERFLNPARRDCPDLDIDLCWRRRDDVIAHVYDTYGASRVAMICTHATLGARSAFRETAKALGVPNARVNGLARRIPRDLAKPYRARLSGVAEARGVDWDEPVLARALALAERLDGAPRHLSIHSGGIVIGDRDLTHYVPLERAAKQIVVTQFEMRAIEAIGLVKMDLLGNRALSTIGECLELVQRGPPAASALDLERIADGDPATAARVAAGDTLNCFQLESPAMRHLVRMLDARSLDDTIAAVALVRPGPAESGMKEAFCRRRRGLEAPAFLHPRLEPVLRSTHGVLLYEEDVMRVAAALAGLSLAEGDDLRRAIGAARTDDEFRSLERGFVAQAARAGVGADVAHTAWRELARFAAYAFCKAHAAGYGALGWHSAYLKTHHPVEYAAAILNHHAGMYATWVHVEDLRRQGVVFRAPCARRSAWDTALEEVALAPDAAGSGAGRHRALAGDHTPARRSPPRAVRVGLGRVFGLAEETGQRLVAARAAAGAAAAFRDLADFIERVRPTLPELESLILAGALDWTARTRPSLLLEARAGHKAWARTHARHAALVVAGAALDPGPVAPVAVPELEEFGLAERVRGECRATGLWFSGHPLDLFLPAGAARGASDAASLPARVGRRTTVVGMPCAFRRVETKAGATMSFLTVADRSGLAECVLFPEVHRAAAARALAGIVRVAGRVGETLGAVTLVADTVQALAERAMPETER
jgi:DNA-directed DNA polymerase III PolC